MIGGRPAMGKTALALDLLLNQSTGKNLVFLQLENNQLDTSSRISKKAEQLGSEVTVTINDLVPQYSEVKIGSSKHVMVHMEKPKMIGVFETLTPILASRKIDGIIIDSFNAIRPYSIVLENSATEKKNLRYLKVMAQMFQKPVFLFSGIHRKLEKDRDYELALMRHGCKVPVVDYSMMLFRWSYYGLEEDMNEDKVGMDDAELVIAKSKRPVREYNPRLVLDYQASQFTSASNDWYDYLERNERHSANE